LREINGWLIITHTPEAQKKVENLLNEMRAGKGEHFRPATRPSNEKPK
jgi:hypothetical protein